MRAIDGRCGGRKEREQERACGDHLIPGSSSGRPKGAAHWKHPQRPNLLQGIAAVKVGPYYEIVCWVQVLIEV